MAIFHSTITSLSTQVKVNGKVRFISFTPKGRPYSYGYLYVNDPDLVAAIKKHPYFGRVITLEVDDTPVVEEKKVPKNIKEYPEVRRTQDAIDILKNEYNYSVETIRTKAAANAAAAELGISFPNL